MRNRFTVIELLTVVAIIGVLVALLIPALSRARFMSKKVTCVSHLRQVYMAASSYSSDNDESLMYGDVADFNNPSNWFFTIQSYLGDSKETVVSAPAPPFMKTACPDSAPIISNIRKQSYGMNYRLRYETAGERWPRLSTTNENPPEMVIYFMDCWREEVDRFYGLSVGSEIIRTLLGTPSNQNGSPRHQGQSLSNVFMDGHGDHLSAEQLWTGHGTYFWDRW